MAKSKLQKKKDNQFSTYWRTKADEEVTRYYTGLPCAICQTTIDTCGHHIVPRDVPIFRHDPDNLIPLCDQHHIWGNEIAPHSSNLLAQEAFAIWLRCNRPKAINLLETYKRYKGVKSDYRQAYIEWKELNERTGQ